MTLQIASDSLPRPEVLTVGASLDPSYGGVSAMMPELLGAVSRDGRFGMSLAAFCEPAEDIQAITGSLPSYSRYDMAGLRAFLDREKRYRLDRQIARSCLVHIHGIWQEHCALAAQRARALRKPYLISAHGMLDDWALRQKRLKKSLYYLLLEKKSLTSAACLHALTESEADSYRRLAPGVPVVVIPNGVTVHRASPEPFLERFPELRGKRRVLFLARLHPKKGLDLLCNAWRNVLRSHPEACLVLAGPDSGGTRALIERQIQDLGIGARVTFTGMLSGDLKWSALAAADLFVLPSYSEGLSVSVLEAMGMARPVIVTEQCHVEGVVEHRCGWQIQPRVDELANALENFFSLPAHELTRIGANGQALVARKYDWKPIGHRMSALYEEIAAGAVSSDLVRSA